MALSLKPVGRDAAQRAIGACMETSFITESSFLDIREFHVLRQELHLAKGSLMGSSLLSLDGATVARELPQLDFSSPHVSSALIQHGVLRQELVVGRRTLAAAVAADEGITTFSNEYTYGGGTLKVGSRTSEDPRVGWGDDVASDAVWQDTLRMAIWEGEVASFHTHMYGFTERALVDFVGTLKLEEKDDFILVRTVAGERPDFLKLPKVVQEVRGLGIMTSVQLTPALARTLPRWKGQSVRGGELFVDEAGSENMYLTLVGDTCVTYVMRDRNATDQDILNSMSELAVSWAS